MKISFDLDDTLISSDTFPLEKKNVLQRLLGPERIRLGTIRLFKVLRSRGHKIYIYTTSYRSRRSISLMFLSYGIPVDFIINQQLHVRKVTNHGMTISKFPPAFNIDIHIDDSAGVQIEGEKHGFRTIIVSCNDENWIETILKSI